MNILVIGVAFTDIKGFPFEAFDPVGTNKGSVTITHGGVSRNVAEDLAKLGAEVELLCPLDDGPLGQDVAGRLKEAGVKLDHAAYVAGGGIGMWLAVFDEKGELAGSISKMPDVLPLEKALEEYGDELVKWADAVVVEFDTSEKIARMSTALAIQHNKPLYVIVGNMSVLLNSVPLLPACRAVIMNEIEAGKLIKHKLIGLEPIDALEIIKAAGREMRLNSFIVTFGEKGCVYADFKNEDYGALPPAKCEVVDTTGAGDAFFSAAVITLTRGQSLKSACENGIRVAAKVVESKKSACSGDCRECLGE